MKIIEYALEILCIENRFFFGGSILFKQQPKGKKTQIVIIFHTSKHVSKMYYVLKNNFQIKSYITLLRFIVSMLKIMIKNRLSDIVIEKCYETGS